MDSLKIILYFISVTLVQIVLIICVYKFACKHETYEVEFGLFMKPKKIKGKLKTKKNKIA